MLATDLLTAGVILLTHRGLDAGLGRFTHLDDDDYAHPFLSARSLRDPLRAALVVLPWLGLGVGKLRGWEGLGDGILDFRRLGLLLAATLVWEELTAPRNAYFRRSYAADRLLTLAFLVAAAWHPVFLFGMLAAWTPLVWQVKHPRCFRLGLHPRVDKSLPLCVLTLILAASLCAQVVEVGAGLLTTLVLAAVASHYVIPALAKLQLGPYPGSWVLRNRLSHLIITMNNYGWQRRRASSEQALRWARRLRRLDPWLCGGALLVEIGAAAILVDRDVALVLLVAFISLHLGILAASGIFFWKWLPVSALLLVEIGRLDGPRRAAVFSDEHLILSLGVLAISSFVLRPFWLGWWDMPLNHFFRVTGTGASGRDYSIPSQCLAPYDQVFGQTTFGFLVHQRLLVGAMGGYETTGPEGRRVIAAVERCATPEQARELCRALGRSWYDERDAACFARFLRRVFAEASRRPRSRLLGALAPPHHFQFSCRAPEYRGQEPLESLAVAERSTFFDGERIHSLRRQTVLRVRIPSAESLDAGARVDCGHATG